MIFINCSKEIKFHKESISVLTLTDQSRPITTQIVQDSYHGRVLMVINQNFSLLSFNY